MASGRFPLLWLLLLATIVIVILARRVDWRKLLDLRLHQPWLALAAAGVQVLREADPAWAAAVQRPLGGLWPLLAMWSLVAAFVVVNLRRLPCHAAPGLLMLTVGFTLNALVTAFNGGMPFSPWAARVAGFSEKQISRQLIGHVPLTSDGVLAPLGDVIPLPGLYRIVSIGDLLMFAGIAVLVGALTGGPKKVTAIGLRPKPLPRKGGDLDL